MAKTVEDHYANHLGPVYTWMIGDLDAAFSRSDEQRILTCFLEYADTTVTVHDLLHQREGASWRPRASSYSKLRLSPDWVAERLSSLGLSVRRDTVPGGMIRIAAGMRGWADAADVEAIP